MFCDRDGLLKAHPFLLPVCRCVKSPARTCSMYALDLTEPESNGCLNSNSSSSVQPDDLLTTFSRWCDPLAAGQQLPVSVMAISLIPAILGLCVFQVSQNSDWSMLTSCRLNRQDQQCSDPMKGSMHQQWHPNPGKTMQLDLLLNPRFVSA